MNAPFDLFERSRRLRAENPTLQGFTVEQVVEMLRPAVLAAGREIMPTDPTGRFVARARLVHGDRYDYEKTVYVATDKKVIITCPTHGDFEQIPYSHLQGQGCIRCAGRGKSNTEEFVAKARLKHGDRYSYEKTVYVTNGKKVTITCPKHGDFEQKANSHLNGQGCARCGGSIRLTTEEFIAKAQLVHGEKYDYNKVVYVNSGEKVVITCRVHGDFEQIPSSHLNGSRCVRCAGIAKSNTEEFVENARKIHGDRYSYEKVAYGGVDEKVIITCKDHGDFEQTPYSHLRGAGCPRCVGRGKTTEEIVESARLKHGDRYSYEKTIYVTAHKKVIITCPEHGDFEQTPNSHLRGVGCPLCFGTPKKTTEQFIEEARLKHGDRYDYNKVVYVTTGKKVVITCRKHGDFEQEAYSHISGRGCPLCFGTPKKTTDEFIEDTRSVHGDRYDYSKTVYVGTGKKVIITCPEHGDFEQTPNSHLKGAGCPQCGKKKGWATKRAKSAKATEAQS